MQFTGDQFLWVFIAQIAAGTLIALAILYTLKRDALDLFQADNGGFILRVFIVSFITLIVGNLTWVGKIPDAAATALFGSILGYVFGVAGKQQGTSPPSSNPSGPSTANDKK